jgi:MFS family permease
LSIRVAEGLAMAATQTGATALLAFDYPEVVARVTGAMDVCESIGFMLGPFVGGLLYAR